MANKNIGNWTGVALSEERHHITAPSRPHGQPTSPLRMTEGGPQSTGRHRNLDHQYQQRYLDRVSSEAELHLFRLGGNVLSRRQRNDEYCLVPGQTAPGIQRFLQPPASPKPRFYPEAVNAIQIRLERCSTYCGGLTARIEGPRFHHGIPSPSFKIIVHRRAVNVSDRSTGEHHSTDISRGQP